MKQLLWISAAAFVAGFSLQAQSQSCPVPTALPGQFVSFPVSATSGGKPAPDGQGYFWNVSPTFFSANPSANHNTTVSGTIPSSASGVVNVIASYGFVNSSFNTAPVYTLSCSIQIITSQPLQINGSCPSATYQPGDVISVPFSASGGITKQYVWSVTSPFSVSPSTGQTTFVQGNAPPQSTTFTVTLSELPITLGSSSREQPHGSITPAPSVTKTCQIVVAQTPLSITGTCPTSAIAPGTAVSIPLTAAGGSGSYAWLISPSGNGLSLSSATGKTTTVQGSPPAGQNTFTVSLYDTVGSLPPTFFTCTITVSAPIVITGTCPAAPLVTGKAFSLPLAVTGGIAPYTWKVSAGPLTPSATTGSNITLSGTPTTAGNFTVSVTVTDSAESTPATFTCTIRVVDPLTITGPTCPVNGVQGQGLTIPLSGAGGSGNFTWSVSGPSFLSLSSNTGAATTLTGNPGSTGNFPFTVSLADDLSTPLSAPFSCSLQITGPLTIGPTTFPDGVLNTAYPATTVAVTGGVPPYTFRISKGSLPPGLTIDSTAGTVTGTPTQSGTFPFTVTVTDTGRGIQSADFQINVVAPLQNTTACPLPTGTELQPYNVPLTATGGNGQFVFSLSGTSLLPPGLVLDKNTIFGTPQSPFPSTPLSFTVTSGSQSQTFSCAIAVLGRKPAVTVNGFFTNAGSPLVTAAISLDAPVQENVSGTAVLSFTPNVPNSAITDNPQVQFCGGNASDPLCNSAQKNSAGLLRVIPFTIPAGTQSINLSPLVTSNVAGNIQITLNNLTVGTQSLTAVPLQFTIPRTAPSFLATPQVTVSGSNLTIVAKVASSTCELTTANAVFTANSGSQLDGASSNIDLTALFKSFTPFAIDSTHTVGGCAFTLTLPFSISGDASAISTVALTLTSSAGSTSTAALPVP